MTFKQSIIFIIVIAIASYLAIELVQYVNGFVDGNNNGKDDVLETWDYLGLNNTDWENQKQRYDYCMAFDQIWNGSSCKLKEIK